MCGDHAVRATVRRETHLLHQTHDSLASHMNTLVRESCVDARASVDPSMILKDFYDAFGQLAIFPLPRARRALSRLHRTRSLTPPAHDTGCEPQSPLGDTQQRENGLLWTRK